MAFPIENQQTEHKLSLSEWREIVESVAAFATAGGGTVLVGIAPDGRRPGVQIGRGTLESLASQVKTNTEPPQYPSITVEGDEQSAVIRVRVEESPVKPVCAFGQPFKRVSRSNQRLTLEEAHRLREQTTGRTWDALPSPGLTARDLDRGAIVDFLRRAGLPVNTPTQSVLDNLRLAAGEGLCHAAALLFARHPHRFLSSVQVQCGRFRGTTSVEFLDEQALEGTVLRQIDQSLAFVARNTRQAIRITGRAEREIIPEYPADAVREAITNAVCHRDYASSSMVQVRIYDDRLEVWNPGTLPVGLSIEALYRQHPSMPRNRLLADALYRARLIEHWGTGTLRIVRECEAAGIPRPEFLAEMGMFIVRFSGSPKHLAAENLGLRQRQAVTHVLEHGAISRAEYRALTGLGARQAAEDLAELVQSGVLTREGRGPATRYVLATAVYAGENENRALNRAPLAHD